MNGVVKTSTKVAGWISIVAALLTLLAKHFNLPVSESFILQVLGLFGLGTGGIVASNYMAGGVQMPTVGALQTKTIESFNHLQSVLPATAELKAELDSVWATISGHLRETPKPVASSCGSIGSLVQAEIDKLLPSIIEQLSKQQAKPTDVVAQPSLTQK